MLAMGFNPNNCITQGWILPIAHDRLRVSAWSRHGATESHAVGGFRLYAEATGGMFLASAGMTDSGLVGGLLGTNTWLEAKNSDVFGGFIDDGDVKISNLLTSAAPADEPKSRYRQSFVRGAFYPVG